MAAVEILRCLRFGKAIEAAKAYLREKTKSAADAADAADADEIDFSALADKAVELAMKEG